VNDLDSLNLKRLADAAENTDGTGIFDEEISRNLGRIADAAELRALITCLREPGLIGTVRMDEVDLRKSIAALAADIVSTA